MINHGKVHDIEAKSLFGDNKTASCGNSWKTWKEATAKQLGVGPHGIREWFCQKNALVKSNKDSGSKHTRLDGGGWKIKDIGHGGNFVKLDSGIVWEEYTCLVVWFNFRLRLYQEQQQKALICSLLWLAGEVHDAEWTLPSMQTDSLPEGTSWLYMYSQDGQLHWSSVKPSKLS